MKTHHITIYGPGCMRCNTLAENTKQAIAAMGADIELHKEIDPMKIAADGVLNTPALALDGKVLLSGKVPSAEEVRELLSKTLGAEACCCGESRECCCAEAASKPQENCCCGDSPAKETGCGCNGGACCGGAKGGSGLKTLLVILALGLVAFAAIRHLEKTTAPENASDSPAVAPAEPVTNGVVLDYFTFGKRCVTCVRMETWAREAVETEFAEEIKSGRLTLRTQDGDPATLRRYGLTAKSLVLRNVTDGKETSWQNLDRIWELNGDEAAYKAYIIEKVKQAL